jgi:hypothetical protein
MTPMSFHSWLDSVVGWIRAAFFSPLSPKQMLRVILSNGGCASIRYCENGGQEILPLIIGLNDHQLYDCDGRVQVCFPTLSKDALREVIPHLARLRNLDTVQLGEVVRSLAQCRKLLH